eukprot:333231_1
MNLKGNVHFLHRLMGQNYTTQIHDYFNTLPFQVINTSNGEPLVNVHYKGSPSNYNPIQLSSFVDPIYTYLVGASADVTQPTGYESYDAQSQSEANSWTQHALRGGERHSVRVAVSRGEHYKWQYMAEYERELMFGLTFEADGFRGKAIKVVVREEVQHKCGYCPMFGDYIVLKNGNLAFQFRNIKGGKRMNLQYKIKKDVFPTNFVNKHLPDYHAEESLLQHKTLNFGGKNQRRPRSNKSPSEVSGTSASTALSMSPGPFGTASEQHNLHTNVTKISLTRSNEESSSTKSLNTTKTKRSKTQRHKKSKKATKKKKSIKKRAKTPEPPHTPV